jgi:hypothetical protein
MKRMLLAALAVSTLVGVANVPAASAAGISINFGNVATGYSDGYWDSGHKWHAWRRGELARYRTEHRDTYHSYRHNDKRDHD